MDAAIQAQFDAMTATIQGLQDQAAAQPGQHAQAQLDNMVETIQTLQDQLAATQAQQAQPGQPAPVIPPTNGPGQQGGLITYGATGI